MEDTFLISTPFKSVRVHPVVLFTILNHYNRRPKDVEDVMGTILGSISNGVLEITNCYAVNYSFDENGLVEDGIKFNENQSRLLANSNKSEVVLGWFSTVSKPIVAEKKWFMMNSYYRTVCQTFKPILLTLNTTFEGANVDVEAHTVTSITVNSDVLAIKLTKVPLEISASHIENEIIQGLLGYENDLLPDDSGEVYNNVGAMGSSMMELMDVLNKTEAYIDKVLKGELKPDFEASRRVFNAIMSVPLIPETEFQQMFLSKLREFAVVSHLSGLAKREVEMAEKMNSLISTRGN